MVIAYWIIKLCYLVLALLTTGCAIDVWRLFVTRRISDLRGYRTLMLLAIAAWLLFSAET